MVKKFSLYGNSSVDCAEVKKKLSLYIDGEVLPEEKRAFEAHLLQCSSCQREMQKLLAIKKLVRAMDRSLESSLSRTTIPDFRVNKKRIYIQKFALVFLISAVTFVSWLAFIYWRELQEGVILQQEIVPVSTFADFDPQLRKGTDSGLRTHHIHVVEVTLER
ncbi:MAG: zf-HC2 domain-containing protein [Atribacterota bacterium]